MPVIDKLIRIEEDGTISFGNYLMEAKTKVQDFEYNGDVYKVKTFKEITKLEKNGIFVYESVGGTTVHNFKRSDKEVSFTVEGYSDAQMTLELEAEKEYKLFVDEVNVGKIKTNLGGKLIFSLDLTSNSKSIRIIKL